MNTIEELKKVDALLAKESNWCKVAFARDKNGITCATHSKYAVKWCLQGAVYKTVGSFNRMDLTSYSFKCQRLYNRMMYELGRDCPIGTIGGFNDNETTTFADIKTHISDTIARLTKESTP